MWKRPQTRAEKMIELYGIASGLFVGIIWGSGLEMLLPLTCWYVFPGIGILLIVAEVLCWRAYSKAKSKEQDAAKRIEASARPAQDGAPAAEGTPAQRGTPGQ